MSSPGSIDIIILIVIEFVDFSFSAVMAMKLVVVRLVWRSKKRWGLPSQAPPTHTRLSITTPPTR
jgi:hypothetical protein